MTGSRENSRRIAKNTLALFVRMTVVMLISLYTSRVVLHALGVTDFGIMNVVSGFVSMFSVVSGALSASISRYLTVAIGRGDEEKTSLIFATSLNLLLGACVLLIIIMEPVGLWFINNKMTLPADRLASAGWVFQISVVTFLINMMSLPYHALVISNEKMAAFSYIGILEAVGKLGVAFLITVSPLDRLVFYALLLALIALCVRTAYIVYCRHFFARCRYHFVVDKPLMKDMLGFSGWNFVGASSSILADQGVNMILNVFCGPAVNAARAIAVQVSTATGSLCGSFATAVMPQLTKSYAAGERDYYLCLCDRSIRFSYYLYFIVALPVMFLTPSLLQLWLGTVPEHTVCFVRLVLLSSLLSVISGPQVTLLLATGEVKVYQLWVGGFRYIVLPACWLLLWQGARPEIVFVVTILTEACCLALRLIRLKIQTGFPVMQFAKKTLGTILVVTLLSVVFPYMAHSVPASKGMNILLVCSTSLISSLAAIYRLGMKVEERAFIREKIRFYLHLL